jgi:hypothetical protein
MVTEVPAVQNEAEVVVRAPFRTKEASWPGARVADPAMKVSGPVAPPSVQVSGPPEVMVQGLAQVGAADPAFVPAKATWQVEGEQEMGVPPLFLTDTAMAAGDADALAPALREAPTMAMLELDEALLTRL